MMVIDLKIFLFILLFFVTNSNCTNEFEENKSNQHNSVDDTGADVAYITTESIVNATLGKSIALTCTVHNLKNYKIAWYHDGILLTLDTIRIYDDDRYSIENKKTNEWKLIINPVDLNDDGHYSCRLNNGLKKFVHLKVGVPPKFTSNDSINQVYLNVNEHEDLSLSCEANGNPMPVIHWFRKNKFISTGVNLHIKNLTRHNHFEYECVARNNVPPDASRHFKININFEPIINLMYHFQTYLNVQTIETESIIRLNDNDNQNYFNADDDENNLVKDERNSIKNLEFVCEIYGNPIDSVSWLKDGTKLKELTNLVNLNYITVYDKTKSKMLSITTNQIKTYKYLSRLQIKNVDEKDNGNYECVVNGFNGNFSKVVNVNDIKPVASNTNLLIHKNNKKNKQKQTTRLKPTSNENNLNNIIELNIDELQTTKKSNILLFNIHHKDQQHENSIENNAFISNRGTRSNSTINLERNNYYYALNENKSNNLCQNFNLIIICIFIFYSKCLNL